MVFARLDRPGPHGSAAEVRTLPAAVRRFLRHPRPRVLVGCVGLLGAVRMARGPWRRRDLGVAVAAAVAQPFVEWGVHRLVLHARPGTRLGALGYQVAGYGHEQHHRDPEDLDTMFLRPREVISGTAVLAVPALLAPPWAATGALCAGLGVLAYDWTHFLIHSRVAPRSAYYRRLWRGHRLHHYRNERFWLGVTSPLGDMVLRTSPPRDAVPLSPTARGAAA
ncbi:Fatty acid hydroxylase-like protein [Frankia canadensis]|uniref:Fatty acid hydroxylase-like protein n=1 Tax=Frankia canadensis TaxID=1836972 RepID=A0A2I2KLY7_9ACTN|nr:sterol desaturase family protein [Frankia canadensis]SNQ46678.1 Fatty acid hydroxylase-like protein [Frankia canadensis]SOU53968.1 Fatty acid hydroxylase-like protein [Frankia canadensis]